MILLCKWHHSCPQFFTFLWSPHWMFYFLQKDYKRDLETEIKGKGMQVGPDTPDIQRAKKASEMASQVRNPRDTKFTTDTMNCVWKKYKWHFCTCGLEIQTHTYLHCYGRLSKALKIIFCFFFFRKNIRKTWKMKLRGKECKWAWISRTYCEPRGHLRSIARLVGSEDAQNTVLWSPVAMCFMCL